jgi:hypothetical protein
MQFFLVSPLFLFLYKWRPAVGVGAILVALAGSIFSTLGVAVESGAYWVVDITTGEHPHANGVIYIRCEAGGDALVLWCAGWLAGAPWWHSPPRDVPRIVLLQALVPHWRLFGGHARSDRLAEVSREDLADREGPHVEYVLRLCRTGRCVQVAAAALCHCDLHLCHCDLHLCHCDLHLCPAPGCSRLVQVRSCLHVSLIAIVLAIVYR